MKVLLIILAILAVVVGLFVFAIMYVALVLYVENLPDNDKEQGDEISSADAGRTSRTATYEQETAPL